MLDSYCAFLYKWWWLVSGEVSCLIPANVARTLRLSIVEGSLGQIFLLWTTGSVLTGYMLHYGASTSEIALVSSVPLLSQLFSPLVAWFASRLSQRRFVSAACALLGRCLWLLAAFAPNLGISAQAMPMFLIALVGLSSFFQASLGTVWTAWMGDVIPEAKRGRYFGRRTGIVGIVGMVANLASGWFLDSVKAPLNFQVVIVVSVGFAVVAAVLLLFHADPVKHKENIDLKDILFLPWQEANFRYFLFFAGHLHFAIFLSGALITVYFLEQLEMSFSQLALWSVIAAVTGLITTEFWGRLADRIGNRAVLLMGVSIMGVGFPILWILADVQDNLSYIWLSAVADAVAWGAAAPALFNLALVSAPAGKRLSYIAMYSVVTGLLGFLGGAISGPLYTFLNHFSFGQWSGYHSLFVLSGVFRLSSSFFLLRVKETKAWDPYLLVRLLRSWLRLPKR
jgi:MFS family permease